MISRCLITLNIEVPSWFDNEPFLNEVEYDEKNYADRWAMFERKGSVSSKNDLTT